MRRMTPGTTDAQPVLAVPRYRGTLAPLPRDRRNALLAHLRQIIWEAMEAPSQPSRKRVEDQPTQAQLDVASWACTVCGGDCCAKGGTHAYLDAETMQRVRRAQPGLGRRELAELYKSYLPAESFSGSCVFHGAGGCALPRALRSDLCNRFYCTALKRFFLEQRSPTVGTVQVRPRDEPAQADPR